MLTYKGSMQDIDFTDIHRCGLLPEGRHQHVGSYFLMDRLHPDGRSVLATQRARGATISPDSNWSPDERWDNVHALLDQVNAFVTHEEEALRSYGQHNVEETGAWLSRRAKLTVIKREALGAMVFDGTDKQPFSVPQFSLNTIAKSPTRPVRVTTSMPASGSRSWKVPRSVTAFDSASIALSQVYRATGGWMGNCAGSAPRW